MIQNSMKRSLPSNFGLADWAALDWQLIGMLIYRSRHGSWSRTLNRTPFINFWFLLENNGTPIFIFPRLSLAPFGSLLIFYSILIFMPFTSLLIFAILQWNKSISLSLLPLSNTPIFISPGSIFFSLTAAVVSVELTIKSDGFILQSFQVGDMPAKLFYFLYWRKFYMKWEIPSAST